MIDSWITKPSILFKTENLKYFIPNSEMTYVEKINAVTRFVWYNAILFYFIKGDINIFFIPIIGMLLIYFLVKWGFELDGMKEDFTINKTKKCQASSLNNPFMNALVSDDRKRMEACEYDTKTKNDISKNFNFNLYKDTDDIYGANNSQRQFYTMPSTTFPNKQNDFANWLYKNHPTCKEGICW